MSDSIGDNRPKTIVKVSGDEDKVQNYNKGDSLNSENDYSDNLKEIEIRFGKSSLIVNRASLDQNIHNVRTILSECINDNVGNMSVTVLAKDNLKKHRNVFELLNSIHVNFDSGNQVLVYSWPNYHQFDENKWNNFLLQLEENRNLGFIGTGVLQFKCKGFNYRVYPPFFSLDHGEAFDYYKPEVFSFSPTEVNKIIEDIKESHQSIEEKIINHYRSLGKDFVKNDQGYIHIRAGIDEKNVKNFTDVSYTNGSDGIDNNPIKEAFVKEEELYKGGLHEAVYTNNEHLLKNLLKFSSDGVNAVKANGKTPLHLAAKYGRKDMVEMLLNKGAKVDIADSRGRTPLHLAAVNGHKDVVEALLKANGINVNAVDEDGKTAFDLATDDKIKTLLQPTEKSNPVDESLKDSEGVQEEEEEEDVAPTEPAQPVSTGPAQTEDVAPTEPAQPVSTGPAQTEEQPSSFFGSLFSILMKPFSLIASFFGGFFSWLFGSDEPTQSLPESDQAVVSEPPNNQVDLKYNSLDLMG